jgi:hypothetical protein
MSEVCEFIDRASRRRKRDFATFSFGVMSAESFFVIKTNFSQNRGFVCYSFSHQLERHPLKFRVLALNLWRSSKGILSELGKSSITAFRHVLQYCTIKYTNLRHSKVDNIMKRCVRWLNRRDGRDCDTSFKLNSAVLSPWTSPLSWLDSHAAVSQKQTCHSEPEHAWKETHATFIENLVWCIQTRRIIRVYSFDMLSSTSSIYPHNKAEFSSFLNHNEMMSWFPSWWRIIQINTLVLQSAW